MKLAASALRWSLAFDEPLFHMLPGIFAHGFEGFEVELFDPPKVSAGATRRALLAINEGARAAQPTSAGTTTGVGVMADSENENKQMEKHACKGYNSCNGRGDSVRKTRRATCRRCATDFSPTSA